LVSWFFSFPLVRFCPFPRFYLGPQWTHGPDMSLSGSAGFSLSEIPLFQIEFCIAGCAPMSDSNSQARPDRRGRPAKKGNRGVCAAHGTYSPFYGHSRAIQAGPSQQIAASAFILRLELSLRRPPLRRGRHSTPAVLGARIMRRHPRCLPRDSCADARAASFAATLRGRDSALPVAWVHCGPRFESTGAPRRLQ